MELTIKVDPHIVNGNPHIEGTRITVFEIVWACKEHGIENFLEEYKAEVPWLGLNELQVVFKYCSSRRCDIDQGHCGGCTLRTLQDNIRSKDEFINRFAKIYFTESDEIVRGTGEGIMIMPGTAGDLDKLWRGEDGWLISAELLKDLQRA